MKKSVSILLTLAMFAFFSSGCAEVSKSTAGFRSDEIPGFTVNSGPHSLDYYQMYGY
jgi:hypothetical protein